MIDILCIAVVAFYTFLGYKRGIVKSVFSLVGTCVVAIIAWHFKDALGNFLIDKMPFFNFPGMFTGITALNILIYKVLAFVVLFVLLYCLLNIILTLAKLIERTIKVFVIFEIPSKILGALLGFIEGLITAFLFLFALFHFPLTTNAIYNSKVGMIILERTPVIGSLSLGTTISLKEIAGILNENTGTTDGMNNESKNLQVLHTLVHYNIISAADAQKLIDANKIQFSNVTIFNQGD